MRDWLNQISCASLTNDSLKLSPAVLNPKLQLLEVHRDSQYGTGLEWFDWISIAASLIGITVTIYFGFIARNFSRKQTIQAEKLAEQTEQLSVITSKIQIETTRIKEETENLNNLEAKIHSDVQRIGDINRPFHKTFPEIMDKLKEIFKEASKHPKSELYIMNRTSAFGKIHTYNPKFYRQYSLESPNLGIHQFEILNKLYNGEKEILDDFNDDEDKCKYLFNEDVRTIYDQIKDCSIKMKEQSLKLIIYNGETENHLQNLFIDKYFFDVNSHEDINEGRSLEYFTYHQRQVPSKKRMKPATINTERIRQDKLNLYEIQNKISDEVSKTHNKVVDDIRSGKKNTDDNKWLKYSTDIPMQMYLLKTIVNGKPNYHTLIINAMSTKRNGNPDRYIDGLSSTEQSLFDVFKTLFDQTFKS